MKNSNSHYINGVWMQGKGPELTSSDPSSGKIVWKGREASSDDVEAAIRSAKMALLSWSLLPLEERINHLENYEKVLRAHQDELTNAISLETGKPLWDASGEVIAMINKIKISIEAYTVRCQEFTKKQPLGTSISRHKPHGILTVFGPYNFPAHLPNGHIVPALLGGNTVIFKPSELTPFVAALMVNCWHESGLPAGVLNLVQGGKNTGKLLAEHPGIDGLLFTGSWQTGSRLAEQFAKTPQKILALEMGGNNPLVVSDLTDIKTAAYLTIQSAYISSGQRCTCARRLILPHTKQRDQFIYELIRMTKSISIGAYDDIPEPFMGPVISEATAARLLEQQQNLIRLGGHPLLPMSRMARGHAYLSPGIIDMTAVPQRPDEEIFGPLLQIIYVNNFKEAIIEANATAYGLTAGIFTNNEHEYREFYAQVKAGVINWNVQLTGASSAAPFGGIGKSGNHRPSAFYAADYCSYPVASLENHTLQSPNAITPGIDYVI